MQHFNFHTICLLALSLLLFSLHNTFLQGQNLNYRKRFVSPFQEKVRLPDTPIIENNSTSAVILYESVYWEVVQQWRTSICRVHRIVQPCSNIERGKELSFVVPESFDSVAQYTDLPVLQRGAIHRPKYFDMEINYVIARIIHRDGRVENTLPKEKWQQETIEFNSIPRNGYSYSFSYDGLEAGDLLEYEYEYSLPYVFDYMRVFFHGNLPKKQMTFQLSYPSNEYYLFEYANGAVPTDSVHHTKNTVLTWTYKNLPPAMSEAGSRPYLSLPYVSYYVHNKTYGVWQAEKITEFKPYTWPYIGHDFVSFKKNNVLQSKKKTSIQEIALNKFVKQQRHKLPAQHSPLQALVQIHHFIVDSFAYKQEGNAYANTDRRLAHLPPDITTRLLKSLNRYKMYNGLFDRIADDPAMQLDVDAYLGIDGGRLTKVPGALHNHELSNLNSDPIYRGIFTRLGMSFYYTQIEDKRCGRINPNICRPMWADNRLYSVMVDDHAFYIYPKHQRSGYYINELPFYLENTVSLNIAQMTDSYYNTKNILFHETPQSTTTENLRTLDAQLSIRTQNKQIDFKGKLSLSGQFSTLLRGLYLYGENDSSLLPIYNEPCYPLTTNKKPPANLNVTLKYKDEQFPFKTDFIIQYTTPATISMPSDSLLYITVGQWINHISIDDFSAQGRVQDYYADFVHSDTYRYTLSFDRPVELPHFKDLPIRIDNNFAVYSFDIQQSSPTQVTIISQLEVKQEHTPVNSCQEVAEVYQTIKKIKKQTIKVRLL